MEDDASNESLQQDDNTKIPAMPNIANDFEIFLNIINKVLRLLRHMCS